MAKFKNKSQKPYKFAHTTGSQKGLGDFYGTGVVAKIGKMRGESMGMQALSLKEMKKPPKSLA
jgi:hypothetical protein